MDSKETTYFLLAVGFSSFVNDICEEGLRCQTKVDDKSFQISKEISHKYGSSSICHHSVCMYMIIMLYVTNAMLWCQFSAYITN